MAVTLKCAACGAEVEFEKLSPLAEATCPGCEVQVRQRDGDERMAIPVSMTLPDKFHHVDLKSVADKSALLVGRYRREDAGGAKVMNSDLVLAKALETLAHSISHLEERLTEQERGLREVRDSDDDDEGAGNGDDAMPESASNGGPSNGLRVVAKTVNGGKKEAQAKSGGGDGKVVQLEPEPEGETSRKAQPVGARVLVRREAAKEAHAFRREKHTQADWDDHAARNHSRSTGFGWLMQNFPKATMAVTLLGAGVLIIFTILSMEDMFTTKRAKEVAAPPLVRTTSLSELYRDDPVAAASEVVARGFLNATSARAAAPLVYEADAIATKFEQFYKPIPNPENYELSLRSRAVTPDGRSIFAYRVSMPQLQPRTLVVLPEGSMPKVFWEFFAEIGDVSWEDFVRTRPKDPVEMRVWVYPGDAYFEPYDREDWQCYILHDYAERYKVYAYADRGTGEDWRIADALKNDPVTFHRHSAVMATMKLTYMADLPAEGGESGIVAEVNEVVATSWLPEQFRGPRKPKEK